MKAEMKGFGLKLTLIWPSPERWFQSVQGNSKNSESKHGLRK
jgi:hypothetical protein